MCDEEVGLLVSNLKIGRSLQVLRLCFATDNLTDQSLLSLAQGLQSFLSLKELRVELERKQRFGENIVLAFLQTCFLLENLDSFLLPLKLNEWSSESKDLILKLYEPTQYEDVDSQ